MRARHTRLSLVDDGFPSFILRRPSEVGFGAGVFGQFDDLGVSDKVAPVDVEDGAETTPMEALEESDVASRQKT